MTDDDKDHIELLASLPGSGYGDEQAEGVTNYTLMPQSYKLPGIQPPRKNMPPPPEFLGSGNKIPESHDSRMRSQFSSPDPALYSRKKRRAAQSHGLSGEVRSSIPCNTYKSGAAAPSSGGAGLLDGRKERQKAEKEAAVAAKQKADLATEHKRLRGQKEAMLANHCMNPANKASSSQSYKIVNIVMDINKKLGLPATDMGSWKLPD